MRRSGDRLPVPPPRIVLGPDDIDATVTRLARELDRDHGDGTVLVGVLRGSVPFLADLVRAVHFHPRVDFVAVTAYTPGAGRVRLLKDLDLDVGGRDVVIVHDIVDTGLTSAFLVSEVERRRPRSVEMCALLDRSVRRVVPVPIAHVGREVGDDYLVGYGLDHEGRYRNLHLVAAVDRAVLEDDPDAYVPLLYGSGGDGDGPPDRAGRA